MLMIITINENKKHFFGENNAQGYEYIIFK